MQKRIDNSEITTEPALARRELLWGSVGFIGVPLCCATPELPHDCVRYERATLIIDLKKAAPLHRPGSAAALVDAGRKLNLIVIRSAPREYAVLERSCTHGGAQCAYNHKRRTLRCTSLNHAEYDLRGTLLHGRTHGNLRAYPVSCSGSQLEIRLEA